MSLSDRIKNKAIVSFNDELAWNLPAVFEVITELANKGYAILGGEVWAITSQQSGLTPLTYIHAKEIAIGMIKGLDGNDYVYNWHSEKRSSETWDDYVKRSKEETMESINKLNAEATVAAEYKDRIYYNLVYAEKDEYENII